MSIVVARRAWEGTRLAEHYFSGTQSSSSHRRQVRLSARGVSRAVWTDNGVFSKDGLDRGTRLLVETADLPSSGTVVDLGCGYGAVTAILSQLYPKLHFVLLDVNERALALARENLAVESDRVQFYVSDGFSAQPDLRADAILLNPPIRAGKQVIYRLFEEAATHLQNGGALWIVINKKHGAESARRKLSETFATVELMDREAGYHIFRSRV